MKTTKDKLIDRFILVAISSEVLAHSILGNRLHFREILHRVDGIINITNNQLYADIIETLRDNEILNTTPDDNGKFDLTPDEEWFDMVQDLVKQVKSNIK